MSAREHSVTDAGEVTRPASRVRSGPAPAASARSVSPEERPVSRRCTHGAACVARPLDVLGAQLAPGQLGALGRRQRLAGRGRTPRASSTAIAIRWWPGGSEVHPVGVPVAEVAVLAHPPEVDERACRAGPRSRARPRCRARTGPASAGRSPSRPGSKAVNSTTVAPLATSRPTASSYAAARSSMSTRGRRMSLAPAYDVTRSGLRASAGSSCSSMTPRSLRPRMARLA